MNDAYARRRAAGLAAALWMAAGTAAPPPAAAQEPPPVVVDSRVLATTRTSTLERELNEAAEAGFRFAAVMGGETALGGKEVVAVVTRERGMPPSGRFLYRLLATTRTSTMERELRDAAAAGFEYRGQTIFESLLGGQEVVLILERDRDQPARGDYRLLATTRTSTLQNELAEAGERGFMVVGMTVGQTALGGKEIVAIVRRPDPLQNTP